MYLNCGRVCCALRRWRLAVGRRRACGRSPAARRGGAAAQSPGREKGGRRCPKGGGGALWEWMARLSGGRGTSPRGLVAGGLDISEAAADALEVSTDQIDDHTRAETCPYERRARACARSCSLGRTRHLCKLLLSLGRLRAARRTLGPEPSALTPPTRTAHYAERGARWALRRRPPTRTAHTKPSPIPSPKATAHPIHTVGEGL